MVWFLAATALLFALLGDYAEAGVLGLALVPIMGMDAYLHRRTQTTTEGFAGRLATTARVVREGSSGIRSSRSRSRRSRLCWRRRAHSRRRPFRLWEFQADESALIGEGMPVRKRPFEETLGGEILGRQCVLGVGWHEAPDWRSAPRFCFHRQRNALWRDRPFGARRAHERTPLQLRSPSGFRARAIAVVVCVALGVTRYFRASGCSTHS